MSNEPQTTKKEKKTLRLEAVPQSALCRFAWNGGGELPEALSGHYTSPASAYQALTTFNAQSKEPVQLEDRAGPQAKTPKGAR